jgi:hypothetical protein
MKMCNYVLYTLLIRSNEFVSEIGFINADLKRVVATPALQCNHSIIAYARNICDVTIRISSGFVNLGYIWEPNKRVLWMRPFTEPNEFNLYYTILHEYFHYICLFHDNDPYNPKPLNVNMIYKALTPPEPIPIELPPEGYHWEACAVPDKRRKI